MNLCSKSVAAAVNTVDEQIKEKHFPLNSKKEQNNVYKMK